MDNNEKMIFAFIFDSGRFDQYCYGDVVFEDMMKGKELSANKYKTVISQGDILIYEGSIDIEPYVIKDEYCTLDFDSLNGKDSFKDYPFCWVIEDIEAAIATAIDKRLKTTACAYVGSFRIDANNTKTKKQFWKELIRTFSLYKSTITCFQDPDLTDVFCYLESAKKLGYTVEYDKDAEYCDIVESSFMQSSFVKCDADLNITDQKETDIDRDIMTLNFSLRQEIQISGVLIWRSINDIDKVHFDSLNKHNDYLIEYPFLALYHSSQGVERMQKAIIETICKKNHISESEKDKVYELLFSHSHDRLNGWIEKESGISFSKNCRKLIDILTRFYNTARYARFSDEGCEKSISTEYELLSELQAKGCDDYNLGIKNNFGKCLGELANTYYKLFNDLCVELNIYAYEIESESAALLVYRHDNKPRNLYQELLQLRQGKKELLYWLIKKGNKHPKYKSVKIPPLDFDLGMIEYYLEELISDPEYCQRLYNDFDYLYDELCSEDKEAWKDRKDLIRYLIANPEVC